MIETLNSEEGDLQRALGYGSNGVLCRRSQMNNKNSCIPRVSKSLVFLFCFLVGVVSKISGIYIWSYS
jgi:hypothetical protein